MNNAIKLESKPFGIVEVLKQTKARFWSQLKAGDVIQLSNEVRYVGGASNGLYATYYKVSTTYCLPENVISGEFSQNELLKYLKLFRIRQL